MALAHHHTTKNCRTCRNRFANTSRYGDPLGLTPPGNPRLPWDPIPRALARRYTHRLGTWANADLPEVTDYIERTILADERQAPDKWPPLAAYASRPFQPAHALPGIHVQATLLGLAHNDVKRWSKIGVRLHVADQIAATLGHHPADLWGDDYWNIGFRVCDVIGEPEEAAA